MKEMKGKDCINRCRECTWFDPAYDQCQLYGTVRVDDLACMEFQPVDESSYWLEVRNG